MRRALLIIAALAIVLAVAFYLFRGKPEEQHATPTPPPEIAKPAETKTAAPANNPATQHLPSLSVAPAKSSEAPAGEISFSGRVVSRATGAGIGEAEMTFAQAEASHSIITAADGTFRFTPPGAGTYQLAAVTAKDYLPFAPAWGESPLVFTARPGRKITDVVVSLDPEKIITGKILSPENKPVAGAKISLLIPAEENMSLVSLPVEHISNAAGTFQFRAPIGTLVEAQHADFELAQERLTESAHNKGEMTIQLRAKSTAVDRANIAGKVIDDHGTGVPNALITAARSDSDRFKEELDWWTARSDNEGAFELRGLVAGKYSLVASSPGLVPARADSVSTGTRDVVLRLHEKGGFIAGRVTSSASSGGVPSFTVVVSKPVGRLEESPIGAKSFLDAEGRYSLGPFEASKYRVRVVAHGYSASDPEEVDVVVGKTSSADFHLSQGATLTGAVLHGETSAPIAGARVELDGRNIGAELPIEVEASVSTGADGSFSLSGIGVGLRSITVEAKGYDGRIMSGLQFAEGANVGPIEVRLTPLKSPDAEPKRELTGIGAALSPEGDVMVIGQLIEGGGALEAGLQPGDRILAINGQPVGELGMNGAVQQIRGPEGTSIQLTVKRTDGREQQITVFRRKIRA